MGQRLVQRTGAQGTLVSSSLEAGCILGARGQSAQQTNLSGP